MLIAAILAIPTVILYFSKLGPTMATVALTLAWAIWVVFVVEAVIMISLVADRWGWIRGHLFGLAIILITFPLLANILQGLLAARALSSMQAVRLLQVLYLAKALKIIKSVLIVHHKGHRRIHPSIWAIGLPLVSLALVGIGHRVATGEKHLTPYHSAWDALDGIPVWGWLGAAAVVLALAGWTISVRRRGRLDGGA